jgi:alpha-tubulin suppressor-like RCC1 family protein
MGARVRGLGGVVLAVCVFGALVLSAPPAAHAANPANAATPVRAITAGVGTTCGLTGAGGVECWGWNFYGTLGIGALNGPQNCYTVDNPVGCSITPVAVKGLGSGVSALASGYAHACALTDAGGVKCWGYNGSGQLGDGTDTGPQLCSSEHPTPCSSTPVVVSGLSSGVSAIGSGWDHTCAVLDSGALECWGSNGDGQLGNGTTTDSSTPVAVQLPEGVKATAVAAGNQHTCALTSTGGVECWGYNGWGLLGQGTETGPQSCGENPCSTTPVAVPLPEGVTATAITSGGFDVCVLTNTGGVMCWGRGEEGELGDGTDMESWTPVAVRLPEGVTVTAIASESFHTCALTSTGSVLCWGFNGNAQLGDETFTGPETCTGELPCSTVPVLVSGLEGHAIAIATGGEYACAVEESGGVQCWGHDGTGGLGIGNTSSSLTPAPVLELMSSLSVSASGAGSGTVSSSAAGIDCGGSGHTSCTALFAPSSTVLLRATPVAGSEFVGFTGGGCGGSGTTCAVSMREAHSVTATFAHVPPISLPGAPSPTIPGTSLPGTLPPTTPAPSAPTPDAPAPGTPVLKVSIQSGSALVVDGRVRVRLSCSGGVAVSTCHGKLLLTVRRRIVRRVDHRRRVTNKTIVLARAGYRLRSGAERTVVLQLTRDGLDLLGQARLSLWTQAEATLSGGRPARRGLAVRLQR